jgi:hypothetical protein
MVHVFRFRQELSDNSKQSENFKPGSGLKKVPAPVQRKGGALRLPGEHGLLL